VDADPRTLLGSSEDAEGDLAEEGRGAQELPGLQGAAGDFDEGAPWRDIADSA